MFPRASDPAISATEAVPGLFKALRTGSHAPALTNRGSLAGCLCQALAYTSRLQREVPELPSRVLVVSVSPDVTADYVQLMNAVFLAYVSRRAPRVV